MKKRPAAPSMPPRARKRPRVNEVGPSRTGRTQERVEVADGGAETEDAWGVRACEEIAWLSRSLEGLTAVGGILVRYVTCLQGRVFTLRTFTVITGPECTYWNAFLFRFPETHFPKVVRIATQLYH